MADVRIEKLSEDVWLLSGELTFSTVPELVQRSGWEITSGHKQVRIDLGDVSHADSAGLALLICWLRDARREGIKILFCKVPEQMLRIARVSGLEGVLPFGDKIE